jgi:hypothetical protein
LREAPTAGSVTPSRRSPSMVFLHQKWGFQKHMEIFDSRNGGMIWFYMVQYLIGIGMNWIIIMGYFSEFTLQ